MIDRFKFRAWYYDKDDENDSDNNKMFYNAQDTYDCLGGNPPIQASSFGDIIDDECWTVEQCTGLKDKNGQLIYEGDILDNISIDEQYEVRWDEDTARFCCITDNEIYDFDNFDVTAFEVIGNIHENADLIKVGGK